MTERRTRGDGGLRWHEKRQRWIAEVTVGYDGRGKRIVRSASGRTRTEAKTKLRDLLRDQADGRHRGRHVGHRAPGGRGLADLRAGHRERGDRGRNTGTMAGKHIFGPLGARKLRDLTAPEVDRWLARLAPNLSTRTLQELRSILSRVGESGHGPRPGDAERCRPDRGAAGASRPPVEVAHRRAGRRGADQDRAGPAAPLHRGLAADRRAHRGTAGAALGACAPRPDDRAAPPRGVAVGPRAAATPRPGSHGAPSPCPARCVEALRKQRAQQASRPARGGRAWQRQRPGVHHGGWAPAWTPRTSVAIFAARSRLVPGIDPAEWTPRELRHSFVSVLSDAGIPVEQIAQLVGHSGTTVTELVYRHQLRPVIQTGATVMDRLFAPGSGSA